MNDDRTDAAAIYALFASVLVNVPDDEVRTRLAQLLAAGADEAQPVDELAGEHAAESAGDLEQRFYDRFVIGVSPLYLPAIESCILDAREDERGRLEPGHMDGPRMTEVLACYRTYGFDHRALEGFQPLVGALRPDHLAAELAFMAHLRRVQEMGGEKGAAAGRFADEFLKRHLLSWVPVLGQLAHQRGPIDAYVQLIDACAAWLELDGHDGAAPGCAS